MSLSHMTSRCIIGRQRHMAIYWIASTMLVSLANCWMTLGPCSFWSPLFKKTRPWCLGLSWSDEHCAWRQTCCLKVRFFSSFGDGFLCWRLVLCRLRSLGHAKFVTPRHDYIPYRMTKWAFGRKLTVPYEPRNRIYKHNHTVPRIRCYNNILLLMIHPSTQLILASSLP